MDGSLPILKELGIEQSMKILGKALYEIFLGKALTGHGNVPKVLSAPGERSSRKCVISSGGELEESVRCQESDIHVDLNSSLTSANSLNVNPLTVLLSSILNSGFHSQSWTCLG